MKKIIMIVVPVILVVGVVAFMFLKPKPPPPDEKALAKEHGITYAMHEPFVVNLADTDARRFAKVGIALGVSKLSMALVPADAHSDKAPPLEMEPEIRDIIIAALQEKTGDELGTKKGRDEVKETIVKHVNKDTELKIIDVYYTEFAIQ